jgi:hypothetical protein
MEASSVERQQDGQETAGQETELVVRQSAIWHHQKQGKSTDKELKCEAFSFLWSLNLSSYFVFPA